MHLFSVLDTNRRNDPVERIVSFVTEIRLLRRHQYATGRFPLSVFSAVFLRFHQQSPAGLLQAKPRSQRHVRERHSNSRGCRQNASDRHEKIRFGSDRSSFSESRKVTENQAVEQGTGFRYIGSVG